MALTGKTISQLDYLQFPTNDTVLPVEYLGDTFHINFSSITYTEGTYSQFVSDANNGILTPGRFYLMTDYQTCYDRPNYDNIGTPITTGNYATGTTEPLLLLATSTTGFSPTVYSTLYPQDKITYDINFNQTEVTNGEAKGRITERIDSRNNRADYDFRGVQFIRYQSFYCETSLPGKLSIDSSGNVTGTGTFFTSEFTTGQILAVYNEISPLGCFDFYEIVEIDADTSMVVSGTTFISRDNVWYSRGRTVGALMNPYQSNIGTYSGSTLYYTFNDNQSYNTYLGSSVNYDTFLLSNNVFLNGPYDNNTFGGNVVGNTFNSNIDSNTCGPYFQFNIIRRNFDRNIIGPYFTRNLIECDMSRNSILESFEHNMLGDDDGDNFDDNNVGNGFAGNFITHSNGNTSDNNIGNAFYNNLINDSFNSNRIQGNFGGNYFDSTFYNNNVGDYFSNNIIRSNFRDNNITGSYFTNTIYSTFEKNTIDANFDNNVLGDVLNIGGYGFKFNTIGSNFEYNNFSGDTQYNSIDDYTTNNNVDTNFSYNQIGSYFQNNTIANDFGFGGGQARGNIVGNWFQNNIVGEYCYNNTFGDNCTYNNLSNNFTNNKISYGMYNTTVRDLDSSNFFENNNITYGFFTSDLTLTGGTGGNPVLYTSIPTNITKDYVDASGYVTFLSGGTIIAQTITV